MLCLAAYTHTGPFSNSVLKAIDAKIAAVRESAAVARMPSVEYAAE